MEFCFLSFFLTLNLHFNVFHSSSLKKELSFLSSEATSGPLQVEAGLTLGLDHVGGVGRQQRGLNGRSRKKDQD